MFHLLLQPWRSGSGPMPKKRKDRGRGPGTPKGRDHRWHACPPKSPMLGRVPPTGTMICSCPQHQKTPIIIIVVGTQPLY
eukprot:scaffold46697_cov72-Cyclotella_meneghiniana.AAC.1